MVPLAWIRDAVLPWAPPNGPRRYGFSVGTDAMSTGSGAQMRELLFVMVSLLLVCQTAHSAPASVPLEDVLKLPDQTVRSQQWGTIALPALPAKPGRIAVLTFRAVIATPAPVGCNCNASVRIDDVPLGLLKADGTERPIGRPTSSELLGHDGLLVPPFNGTTLVIMFAPNADVGDTMTADGLGATFTFDISDVARTRG